VKPQTPLTLFAIGVLGVLAGGVHVARLIEWHAMRKHIGR
jgi:hypothetical protein